MSAALSRSLCSCRDILRPVFGARRGTYVEQNHRAQILYVEEDRELMEQAWELAAAHREDLAGRCPHPPAAVQDRPSVIALLQRASEVS